jgi:hypothetical protein
MTELAYMVREHWTQHGTAMRQQSAVIREWLGNPPYIFATADRKKYEQANSADREFVTWVAPAADERRVVDLPAVTELRCPDKTLTRSLVVLHPYGEQHCDLLRGIVEVASIARLFVVVWSPRDMVRMWLDGLGAVDLHTGATFGSPDAVQLEAARCWVDEQYNGLASGNGKAAVVQILRVFTSAGYPLDTDSWLRVFFAAGGKFRHAPTIAKLITEMQAGTRHRITARYRPEILSVLRERANESGQI